MIPAKAQKLSPAESGGNAEGLRLPDLSTPTLPPPIFGGQVLLPLEARGEYKGG